MSVPAAVAAVLTVGLITYGARAGPILALADRAMPAELQRALRYVGPAVLSALVVSLLAGGRGIGGVEVVEVVAVASGSLVAARTKNLIASLAAGMVVLWVLLLVVP